MTRKLLAVVAIVSALGLALSLERLIAPSAAQEFTETDPPASIETITVPASPTATVAPPPAAEPEPSLLTQVMSVLRGWLSDLLYWAIGIAVTWAAGALGLKNWNAAKVDEVLHNEKMKPYAEAVINFAIGVLTRALGRVPKVGELLEWIAEQFPEVRSWAGRNDKERVKYFQTFLDAPAAPLQALTGEQVTVSASAGSPAARPGVKVVRKRKPVTPKVDPLKPPSPAAATPATA